MGKIQIDRALNCHCHHTFGATSDPRAAPAAARHAFQFRFLKLFQLQRYEILLFQQLAHLVDVRNAVTLKRFTIVIQPPFICFREFEMENLVEDLVIPTRRHFRCSQVIANLPRPLAQGLVLPPAKITSTPNSYFEDVNHL